MGEVARWWRVSIIRRVPGLLRFWGPFFGFCGGTYVCLGIWLLIFLFEELGRLFVEL